MNSEIEEYRRAVEFFAETNSSDIFSNRGKEHATIVLANLFKYSKNNISILAQNLTSELTSRAEYRESLLNFIDKTNGKLKVLITESPDLGSYENSLLEELCRKGIKVKKLEKKNESIQEYIRNINFTVGDGKMFRIETNLEEKIAECCFNNQKIAEKLEKIFDKLYSEAGLFDPPVVS